MAGEPMDNLVARVIEFTGQYSEDHKAMFRKALMGHKESPADMAIGAVANEFFENEVAFSHKYSSSWDEGMFSANRDGSNPTFSIQGADEPAPNGNSWQNGNSLSAPSRPPSRTQNRSPLDPPRTQAEDDEDLQRGIQASMEQGLPPGSAPQESGITAPTNETLPFFGPPTRESYFGPATRLNYDDDSWAMVPVKAKSFDPSPSRRKRDSKVPVFLTCRLEQGKKHRLGPLIMMLHEIPAARNFFLLLEGSSQSYGNHKEWWKGEQILSNSEAPEMWTNDYQDVSLVDELQRLMAFLDQTDRSYGTADSVCENQMIKSAWGDPILRFYESLYNCSNSQELMRMWTTVNIDNISGDPRPQEFAILDFRIPDGTPEVLRNLYSQWDYLFWIHQENGWEGWQGRQDGGLNQIASIQTPAQVMTMRITTDVSPVEVPEVLYIDRYLESNVKIARTMQNKMFRMWKAIDASREKEIELSQWNKLGTWPAVDKIDLAKKVIEKSEDQIWQIRADALWRMHEESIGTDEQIPYLPDELSHLAPLNEDEDKAVKHFEAEIGLAKLRLARIDQKLARIRAERDACCALLEELNKTFTVPSEDPTLNPTHKYSLRGVITSPDVLHMCVRKQREPWDDGGQEYDQWYRISWVPDDVNPVQQEETTIDKVKEAMFTEVDTDGNRAPILVYATEEALRDQPRYLSSALQTFVKRDNRLFGQELKEEPPPRDKKRVAIRSPQSPPKRQRSDSADSMATNRASLGDFSDSEERAALLSDQFDEPFGDGIMETEMTDMRPISQDEIAAHMVPPTPPLSADDASDQDSPGLRRSSEKLANFSLNDDNALNMQQEKGKAPEMEELKTPFIVRRPASGLDNRASIMERPLEMEIDTNLEIPSVNPEEYYNQTC